MGTSSGTASKTNASGQIARALHASLKTKPPRVPEPERVVTPKWARKYAPHENVMTMEAWEAALKEVP